MDYLIQLIDLWDTFPLALKVVGVLIVLHPVFSTIVALTPTPKDDTVYAKFYKMVIEPMALVVFRAKDK